MRQDFSKRVLNDSFLLYFDEKRSFSCAIQCDIMLKWIGMSFLDFYQEIIKIQICWKEMLWRCQIRKKMLSHILFGKIWFKCDKKYFGSDLIMSNVLDYFIDMYTKFIPFVFFFYLRWIFCIKPCCFWRKYIFKYRSVFVCVTFNVFLTMCKLIQSKKLLGCAKIEKKSIYVWRCYCIRTKRVFICVKIKLVSIFCITSF